MKNPEKWFDLNHQQSKVNAWHGLLRALSNQLVSCSAQIKQLAQLLIEQFQLYANVRTGVVGSSEFVLARVTTNLHEYVGNAGLFKLLDKIASILEIRVDRADKPFQQISQFDMKLLEFSQEAQPSDSPRFFPSTRSPTDSIEEFAAMSIDDYLLQTMSSANLTQTYTAGGGDCAFHAVLGQWDANKNQIICAAVDDQRRQVANAIRECKPGEPLFSLMQEAIKAIIMENRPIEGKKLKEAQEAYQQYQREDTHLMRSAWAQFETKLRENPNVLTHIEDFIEDHCSNKDIPVATLNSLQLKFSTCLNEDDTLAGILLSIPDLHKAYNEYNKQCSQGFRWEEKLKQVSLIEEYAHFIETPGQWILPLELDILAKVFEVSVVFYTRNWAQPNNPPLKVGTYNAGKQKTVMVCFNGTNHYEQMANDGKNPDISLQQIKDINNDSSNKSISQTAYSLPQTFMAPPRLLPIQGSIQQAEKRINSSATAIAIIFYDLEQAKQFQTLSKAKALHSPQSTCSTAVDQRGRSNIEMDHSHLL